MLTRVALGLMWLLHFLPVAVLAPLGRALGLAFHALGRERRAVVAANLAACFPGLSEAARRELSRAHFQALGRSLLDRALLWWGRPARIRRLAALDGIEHIPAGRPVILLVPHFVGLDVAFTRLALERDLAGIYGAQKNAAFDRFLLGRRMRFGRQLAFSRQQGMRRAVRAIREGIPFFYLPDMDYGPRDALFVPFFGVEAATVTGLSRLARMTGAKVLPVIVRMLPGARGYSVSIRAAWSGFPGASLLEDTRRMNAFIEGEVRAMPEQYYWVHKRFKTRPPGAPALY
ncbi:MAG: lysophospholipid acyltransferase family protein [Rhodocyclaceae bacterium]